MSSTASVPAPNPNEGVDKEEDHEPIKDRELVKNAESEDGEIRTANIAPVPSSDDPSTDGKWNWSVFSKKSPTMSGYQQ